MPRPVTSQSPEAVKKREKRAEEKRLREAATPTTESGTSGSSKDVPPDGLAVETQPVELTAREKKLAKNLTGLYGGVGTVMTGFHMLAGQVVMLSAEARADELVKFARHNKELFERLEKFCAGNDMWNMILGHASMLFAVLVAVDRVPLGERAAIALKATGYEALLEVKLRQRQQAEAADVPEAAAA